MNYTENIAMKSNLLKDFLICIVLLVICIPAVKDLFIPGGYTSHDFTHHVIRQISMDKLLNEGQLPPRWSGELNHEYGYPVFLFNYPLPPIIGEIFHKLGWGYVDSVKAILILSILISPIGMYLFLKSLFNDRLAAFLGAVFWVYAPVRFLNVYVAAAVGNALACGIVPFVFWCTTEVLKTQKLKWGILGGFFLNLLILTHNVSTVMFLPVLFIFILFYLRLNKVTSVEEYKNYLRIQSKRSRSLWTMGLLGFGLSAWFWIPAIYDKQFIRYDTFMSGFYKDKFVDFYSLIRSKWGYGGDFSNEVGIIHILVLLFLILSFIKIRKSREIKVLGIFCLVIFSISIFLTQKVSLFLWDSIPFLSYIQFPNRFLTVSVFIICIALGLLIHNFSESFRNIKFKCLSVLVLFILVIYANRNHWHINQSTNYSDSYYETLKTTATAYDEHLPNWAKPQVKDPLNKVEFKIGKGDVEMIKNHSGEISAEVSTEALSRVKLNQYFFPGWNINIDQKPVKMSYLMKGDDYGLMEFDLPAGKHLLDAKFNETPVRRFADIVSIISYFLVITYLLKSLTFRFK